MLYNYGGVYFDTDVEVIKDMTDIIDNGSFMGIESLDLVNPGLGISSEPGSELYKSILADYNRRHFIRADGSFDQMTIGSFVTGILIQRGFDLTLKNQIQNIDGVLIYPEDYFCPIDYMTGKMNITNNTRSIHHYSESWHTKFEKAASIVSKATSNKGILIGKAGYLVLLTLIGMDSIKKRGVLRTMSTAKKFFNKRFGGVCTNNHIQLLVIAGGVI